MELSMFTSLEIFTNPGDLEIIIRSNGGKYGFAITRGPGHNHKVLIDSNGFADTMDGVIKMVKETLESIHESLTKDCANRKSLPSQYLNPDGLEIDQVKVLNLDLIGRIIDELHKHRIASTYKMLTPTI